MRANSRLRRAPRIVIVTRHVLDYEPGQVLASVRAYRARLAVAHAKSFFDGGRSHARDEGPSTRLRTAARSPFRLIAIREASQLRHDTYTAHT
jgi:hypothetical protein